jgi:hypothetical protein
MTVARCASFLRAALFGRALAQRDRSFRRTIQVERRRAAYVGVLERMNARLRAGEISLLDPAVQRAYDRIDHELIRPGKPFHA